MIAEWPLPRQLSQDVRQDSAVAIVFDLIRRVDPHERGESFR